VSFAVPITDNPGVPDALTGLRDGDASTDARVQKRAGPLILKHRKRGTTHPEDRVLRNSPPENISNNDPATLQRRTVVEHVDIREGSRSRTV
jgi:hypothetical protein